MPLWVNDRVPRHPGFGVVRTNPKDGSQSILVLIPQPVRHKSRSRPQKKVRVSIKTILTQGHQRPGSRDKRNDPQLIPNESPRPPKIVRNGTTREIEVSVVSSEREQSSGRVRSIDRGPFRIRDSSEWTCPVWLGPSRGWEFQNGTLYWFSTFATGYYQCPGWTGVSSPFPNAFRYT